MELKELKSEQHLKSGLDFLRAERRALKSLKKDTTTSGYEREKLQKMKRELKTMRQRLKKMDNEKSKEETVKKEKDQKKKMEGIKKAIKMRKKEAKEQAEKIKKLKEDIQKQKEKANKENEEEKKIKQDKDLYIGQREAEIKKLETEYEKLLKDKLDEAFKCFGNCKKSGREIMRDVLNLAGILIETDYSGKEKFMEFIECKCKNYCSEHKEGGEDVLFSLFASVNERELRQKFLKILSKSLTIAELRNKVYTFYFQLEKVLSPQDGRGSDRKTMELEVLRYKDVFFTANLTMLEMAARQSRTKSGEQQIAVILRDMENIYGWQEVDADERRQIQAKVEEILSNGRKQKASTRGQVRPKPRCKIPQRSPRN